MSDSRAGAPNTRPGDLFADLQLAADAWIAEHGTDALVRELREAIADGRRVKLGTTNVLILLAHIDKLEAGRVR